MLRLLLILGLLVLIWLLLLSRAAKCDGTSGKGHCEKVYKGVGKLKDGGCLSSRSESRPYICDNFQTPS
jgi:hypothetical protein